jgi:hypothetical protein
MILVKNCLYYVLFIIFIVNFCWHTIQTGLCKSPKFQSYFEFVSINIITINARVYALPVINLSISWSILENYLRDSIVNWYFFKLSLT